MSECLLGVEKITKNYSISTMLVCFDIRYFPVGPDINLFSSYKTREEALNIIKETLINKGIDADVELNNFKKEYYN